MKFTVKLADKTIEMNSIYPTLKRFCGDYCIKNAGAPDFAVSWTMDEIKSEQTPTSSQNYSEEYLETLAALRKVAEKMPYYDRLLFHGAAITYDDNAYLFTAPSGTGKSTHIKLWRKYLGKRTGIINGDKPFLSVNRTVGKSTEDMAAAEKAAGVRVYGTPWAGKENWHQNKSAAVAGICIINRGEENSIRRIKPDEGLVKLLHQVYIPSDTAAAGLTLELMDLLLRNVPLYTLECDMSEDAVKCSFEAMTGLKY